MKFPVLPEECKPVFSANHSVYGYVRKIRSSERVEGRSQWPRGLGHEPSSLVRTLGSWVRIPLEGWMSVFVLFCV
jgi:hypothetical protein